MKVSFRSARFQVLMSAIAVTLVAGLSAPTQAASTKAHGPAPFGVYTDKAVFARKVSEVSANTSAPEERVLSQSDKERLKGIEEEFDKLDPLDIEAQDKLAKKHGLVVYRPLHAKRRYSMDASGVLASVPTSPDDGSVIQSIEGDVSMDIPYITYDSATYHVGINGQASWFSSNTALNDKHFWYGFGKPDAFTLVINNIASKTIVKSQNLRTYNTLGNESSYTATLFSTPLQNRVWPVTLRFQDSGGCINGMCIYDDARMSMWVWTYGLSSPVEVTTIYAHDWVQTELESIGFNTGFTSETKKQYTFEFGLTWNWKFGTDAWAAESNTIGF